MQDLSFTLYERLENNESKFVGRYYNGYSEKQVIDIVCNRTKAFDKGRMLYVVDDLAGNIIAEIKDGKRL